MVWVYQQIMIINDMDYSLYQIDYVGGYNYSRYVILVYNGGFVDNVGL